MGREQSIYRHPGFLLFRQWGSADAGPLHVTLPVKLPHLEKGKLWVSGQVVMKMRLCGACLPCCPQGAVTHSPRCSTHGLGHLLGPVRLRRDSSEAEQEGQGSGPRLNLNILARAEC